MSEGFSGVVRLSDVDDFIAPSQVNNCDLDFFDLIGIQNCIIPLTGVTTNGKLGVKLDNGTNDADAPLVAIRTNKTALTTQSQKKPVKITLNDCLACSGCVTTAEAVLIEQQSGEQLVQALASHRAAALTDRRIAIVTVSPQSLSSIAVSRQLTLAEAAHLVVAYFKQAGLSF